jgi:hypothetical protein
MNLILHRHGYGNLNKNRVPDPPGATDAAKRGRIRDTWPKTTYRKYCIAYLKGYEK